MPNQILLDRWTLQEISQLIDRGLSNDTTGKIVVEKKKDSHHFDEITHGSVQIQALFSFLQNLVLRETIIVDDSFSYVWEETDSLKQIESNGLIKLHNFQEHKYVDIRKAIVSQLCTTSSIREIQLANEQEWEINQTVVDNFMSQIIWGGAGMLARSHEYKVFYESHPLRSYAIQQSPIVKRDSYSETLDFISTNQTKLLFFENDTSKAVTTHFSLPPFISLIIEESNSLSDLFKVALELRENYSDLREWIKQFQIALDNDSTKEIAKYIKTLESIQKHIESKYNPDKYGSLDLGFDFFSFSPSVSLALPINKLRNRIGVRSTINDLILSDSGHNSIRKLFKLLSEERTQLGKQVFDDLIQIYTKN
ncbi:MAG TPA: hypothetical protein DHV30_17295 [Balneola sp.]|nr:hypothetical protein [Balneola sp.]